jgi:hypothetical protein
MTLDKLGPKLLVFGVACTTVISLKLLLKLVVGHNKDSQEWR